MIQQTIVFTMFFIILVMIYASTFYKKESMIDRFVTRMPIASQFILGLGIYITYLLFKTNYSGTVARETGLAIKETYVRMYDILEDYKEKSPNLINSFFFNWQKDGTGDSNLSQSFNKDNNFDAMILSNKIFEVVDIYAKTATLTSLSDSRFLIFISSFYKSKLLKNEWNKYYLNYGENVRNLSEKLFEINEKENFKSAEEIKDYFEKFVGGNLFKQIITKIDKTNITQTVLL